jgi:hypothetical protein
MLYISVHSNVKIERPPAKAGGINLRLKGAYRLKEAKGKVLKKEKEKNAKANRLKPVVLNLAHRK